MTRVDLEETTPAPSTNIPTTSYHVLPSGNLGSSSRILDVPSSPHHNNDLDNPILILPFDDPRLWNDEPRLESVSEDPAYLEHIDADYVTTRRSRLYVSHFQKCLQLCKVPNCY